MKAPKKTRTGARLAREQRALLACRGLVDRMRSLYDELERKTNASIATHRAMAFVGAQEGLPAWRLAQLLGMKRPALSHVLKKLGARGWIERRSNGRDRRSIQLYLTAEGRGLLRRTSGRVVGTLQRALGHLSDHKLNALARNIEEVMHHVGRTRRRDDA